MSCIAYRRTVTGVLNRVMVVVLLGCVGLTAGLAFGTLFSGNQSATSLFPGHGPVTSLGISVVEPPKSSFTFPARFRPAADLVRLTRMGHFPGVRVFAHGERVIELSPKPFSPEGRWNVCVANRRYCDGCGRHTCGGTAGLAAMSSYVGPMGSCILFGLLAGLSAAFGFLVPPRSRVTAAH
jgi:hypothetical protein